MLSLANPANDKICEGNFSRNKKKRKKNKQSNRLNKQEHKVNALALGAEEGRDKLRKAAGRSKYPSIRRYPNGATHLP